MTDIAFCACGSGLRRLRCCAADPAALPLAASVQLLDDQAAAALVLLNAQKHAEAERLTLKILDLAPAHRAAMWVLFSLRHQKGPAMAAEALARRLAALPGTAAVTAAAQLQLAQLIMGQGRYAEAEAAAQAAVAGSPRNATARHVLGVVLTETGQIIAGEMHYRRALALLGQEDGTVLGNLAWNLKLQGRLDEAAGIYGRALALKPDNARAIGGFAQVEMARQHLPEAARLLDEAIEQWPLDRALRLLRTLLDLRQAQPEAALARLSEPAEALLPAELSLRGQAFAQLDQPVEAVRAYALGKAMHRERYGQKHKPDTALARAAAYREFFTADQLQGITSTARPAAPQPVFLLGFPRSGTALLEQLLSQVPGIIPGDDFLPMEHLVEPAIRLGGAAYPEVLAAPACGGMDLLGHLRAIYDGMLEGSGVLDPTARFITHRAADNHWHLGLIRLLFPDAPVIHLLRHPLDVMLANLAQDRKLEANCQVSMAATARHYDLGMSMIRHFRGQLTLRYLAPKYEALVTDPAAVIGQILAFIGAPDCPDAAALQDNKPVALRRTPAHMAGQCPVHTAGLWRHRHYESLVPGLFTEARPILAPWIGRLGYGDAP